MKKKFPFDESEPVKVEHPTGAVYKIISNKQELIDRGITDITLFRLLYKFELRLIKYSNEPQESLN